MKNILARQYPVYKITQVLVEYFEEVPRKDESLSSRPALEGNPLKAYWRMSFQVVLCSYRLRVGFIYTIITQFFWK